VRDALEAESLMPALGRIITCIEELRKISNISSAIELAMYNMKEKINGKLDEVEQSKISDPHMAVK
jgi:hypothetical protein